MTSLFVDPLYASADGFVDRARQLAALKRYLRAGCRLCTIYGVGGVGKSALAYQFAALHEDFFNKTLWYTLTNAPPLSTLVEHLCSRFPDRPVPVGRPLTDHLFDCLVAEQCLVVLDNLEVLLDSERFPTHFRPSYEEYGPFLQRLATTPHQSLVLVTSREKPALIRAESQHTRSLRLPGLTRGSGRTLLARRRLRGNVPMRAELVERYDGNPLALNLAADLISDLHGGDIGQFLASGDTLFHDLQQLLDEHFRRLSSGERLVLFRLAVARQPLSVREIVDGANLRLTRSDTTALLHQLLRRSLVQERQGRFLLQYMVLEFVTLKLVGMVADEVGSMSYDVIGAFALVDAAFPEYVRQSQRRFVTAEVTTTLRERLGSRNRATARLDALLDASRFDREQFGSFAAANALALLSSFSPDLSATDLSRLVLRQADLSTVRLDGATLRASELSGCRFPDTYHYVFGLDFSPDGQAIAVGENDGSVSVLSVPDGRRLRTFAWPGAGDYIRALAYSPDGTLVACAGDHGRLRLWNLVTGWPLDLTGHDRLVRAIAFSAAGTSLLAGGMDPRVLRWSLDPRAMSGSDADHDPDAHAPVVVGVHPGAIWGMDGSPSGTLVAVAGDVDCLAIWDWDTGEALPIEPEPGAAGRWVRFTSNGEHVVVGCDDGVIRIWHVASGRLAGRLEGHDEAVWGLAIAKGSSGDRLISGSRDGTIRIWDIGDPAQGRALRTIRLQDGAVWPIGCDAESRVFAAATNNSSIRFWDVDTTDCLEVLSGTSKVVLGLAGQPHGHLLATGGHDHVVRIWDARDGRCLHELAGHTAGVRGLAFNPSGTLLASASEDWDVRLWNVADGTGLASFTAARNWVCAVAFDPSGRYLAGGGADLVVRVWDVRDGELVHELAGHRGLVWCLAFGRDDNVVYSSGEDGELRAWDLTSGRHRLVGEVASHVRCLHVIGRDRLVAGSSDGYLRLWDLAADRVVSEVLAHEGGVLAAGTIPGQERLVTGGRDDHLRRWALPDLVPEDDPPVVTGSVRSLAWLGSDGTASLAYAGADEAVRVCEADGSGESRALRIPRQFEGLDITGTTGLTAAQIQLLCKLGAVDRSEEAGLPGPGRGGPGVGPTGSTSSTAAVTPAEGPPALSVFVSYSHKDDEFRAQLASHMSGLRWTGVIDDWSDRRLTAGDEWRGEIDSRLESADVILLLVSADFLASDYCRDVEMARAMQRHREGTARVVPVILRECDWRDFAFGDLQALPRDGLPIRAWADADAAFTHVAFGVRTVIESLQQSH